MIEFQNLKGCAYGGGTFKDPREWFGMYDVLQHILGFRFHCMLK